RGVEAAHGRPARRGRVHRPDDRRGRGAAGGGVDRGRGGRRRQGTGGRGAQRQPAAGDAAGGPAARGGAVPAGGVRAGRGDGTVRRLRGRAGAGERQRFRLAGGRV